MSIFGSESAEVTLIEEGFRMFPITILMTFQGFLKKKTLQTGKKNISLNVLYIFVIEIAFRLAASAYMWAI